MVTLVQRHCIRVASTNMLLSREVDKMSRNMETRPLNIRSVCQHRHNTTLGSSMFDSCWSRTLPFVMSYERFVKLGTEAARLGLRVNCVVSRDFEYALSAYEAIDREVPIRDRRWVVIHVNQASDEQIRRMKALGVIATVVPGFLWMAGDRYGLDQLGEQAIPIRRMLDGGVPVALSTD